MNLKQESTPKLESIEVLPNDNIEQHRKRLAKALAAVARYEQDPAIRDKPLQG